jgi:SAM-dependent methyltransferase
MTFDKEYTDYWKRTVVKSVDGTRIAGESEVRNYLEFLPTNRFRRILDLGCSFGRMYKVLTEFSLDVHGVDVDNAALEMAKLQGYSHLSKGSTESIPYQEGSFDLVFCWAVFDAVSQYRSLIEFNRVLMDGGYVFLTGKNDSYFETDQLAFTAEKNAFLKGHPNNFTNLPALIGLLPTIGFQIEKLLIFDKRGDIGEMIFREEKKFKRIPIEGYEYLLIFRKKEDSSGDPLVHREISTPFSKTAIAKSSKLGHDSPSQFFQELGSL